MVDLGLEFIKYQHQRTPFAQALIAFVQKGIDLRESVPASDVKGRFKKIMDWYLNTGKQELKDIVEKYTGCKVDTIKTPRTLECGYSMCTKILDKGGWNAYRLLEIISGRDYNGYTDYMLMANRISIVTYQDLEKLIKAFDENAQKWKKFSIADFNFSITLEFDPYCTWLMKELGHQQAEQLTAEEVAAIVLHEYGHTVSTVLLSLRRWYVLSSTAAVANECMKKRSLEANLDFFNSIPDEVYDALPDFFKTAVDKATKIYNTVAANNMLGVTDKLLCMFFRCLLYLLFSPITLGIAISRTINRNISVDHETYKTSDFYFNTSNIKYSERLADSYATHCGLGPENMSALRKIHDIEHSIGYATATSKLVYYAGKMNYLLLSLIRTDGYLYDEHDDIITRTKQVAMDTVKALKLGNLPDTTKQMYIEEYDNALEVLTKIDRTTKAERKIRDMQAFVMYVLSAPLAMIINGHFAKEYDKLYQNTEKILANDLGYYASKLELMAKKK